MYTKTLFIVLFCLSSFLAQSQDFSKMNIPQLDSMAKLLQEKGVPQQAMLYSNAALEKMVYKSGKDTLYADRLFSTGVSYFQLGYRNEILPYWQEAYAIFLKVHGRKHPKTARMLNALGALHKELKNLSLAEDYLLESKEVKAQIYGKKHPEYAKTVGNLASLYGLLQRYNEAEPLYLEAREIWVNTIGKETYDYAGATLNLAALYVNIEQPQKAEVLYLEVLEIYEKIYGELNPYYAQTLESLGSLYGLRPYNDLAKAEALYTRALRIKEELTGKGSPYYLNALTNFVILYKNNQKWTEALNFANEIEETYKTKGVDAPYRYAVLCNSFFDIYVALEQYEKVTEYAFKAIELNIGRSIGHEITKSWADSIALASYIDNSTFITSLQNLYLMVLNTEKGEVRLQKRQIIEALALAFVKKCRDQSTSDADKLFWLSLSSHWAMNNMLSILNSENSEKYPEAFSLAERTKSTLLADEIRSKETYAFGGVPDSLMSKEQSIKEQLTTIQAAIASNKEEVIKSKLQSELNELNSSMVRLQKEISRKYPEYVKIRQAQSTATVEEIQALLDKKTALIEFAVEEKVVLFYIDKTNYKALTLSINADSLTPQIHKLRDALTDYASIKNNPELAYQNYSQSAYWLYQQLLAPLLKEVQGIDHLIIIPDAELGHLPFETFLVEPAPSTGNYAELHYLIKDFSINYNYSATLWQENLQSKPRKNNGQLFAFAADYQTKVAENVTRSGTLTMLRSGLNDLPAAKMEVGGLEAKFAGIFLQNEEANENHFKLAASDYAVIHLAMHGILNKQAPLLSSLVFTENGDSLQDNFLQAWEISNLTLNANLVVLSACETGYGKFERGNGVASLARSFMYAGVPAMVVSLWQVNDGSTAIIMESFYQNLSKGLPKDSALRQAKLAYLKNTQGIAAHPAFWSPFIQLGDSRPIQLKTKGGWLILGIAITTGLLVLGLGAFALQKKNRKEAA